MNIIRINIKTLILEVLLYGSIMGSSSSIIGTVNDALKDISLLGANVEILETTMGAATDINGKFRINNIIFIFFIFSFNSIYLLFRKS